MWRKSEYALALILTAAPAIACAGENAAAHAHDTDYYQKMTEQEKRKRMLESQIELFNKEIELLEKKQQLQAMREHADVSETAAPSLDEHSPPPPDPISKMTVNAIVGENDSLKAEIRYGGGVLPVSVGDALPGMWRVKSISATGIVVAKGKRTRVIPMPDKPQPPQAPGIFPMLPPPPPASP